MSENFKKHPNAPTPALEHGSQQWGNKTKGNSQSTYPHGQDPHQTKKPKGARDSGTKHKKSPPVVPHHTTNPDWNYPSGHPLQIRPQLGPLVKPWAPIDHPMTKGQGGQNRPDGSQKASKGGMGSTRPYSGAGSGGPADVRYVGAGQKHDMAGAIRPRIKLPMTKHIKGMIGKGKKKVHRSPY